MAIEKGNRSNGINRKGRVTPVETGDRVESSVEEGDLGRSDLKARVRRVLAAKDGGIQKRELTLKQAEVTLQTFEARFRKNKYLHREVMFENVKKSLEANPEALWSVAQMEAQGHEPDVYASDKDGFEVGTCAKESPESSRNCVYDEEAARLVRSCNPYRRFNGSAVEKAEAMGIGLMDVRHYEKKLQKNGEFDKDTFSWLLTDSITRSSGAAGRAFLGNRSSQQRIHVIRSNAYVNNERCGFRGSLRVAWKV